MFFERGNYDGEEAKLGAINQGSGQNYATYPLQYR